MSGGHHIRIRKTHFLLGLELVDHTSRHVAIWVVVSDIRRYLTTKMSEVLLLHILWLPSLLSHVTRYVHPKVLLVLCSNC